MASLNPVPVTVALILRSPDGEVLGREFAIGTLPVELTTTRTPQGLAVSASDDAIVRGLTTLLNEVLVDLESILPGVRS